MVVSPVRKFSFFQLSHLHLGSIRIGGIMVYQVIVKVSGANVGIVVLLVIKLLTSAEDEDIPEHSPEIILSEGSPPRCEGHLVTD